MASEHWGLRRGEGQAAATRAVPGEAPFRWRVYASRALFALAILAWGVLVWWANR